jgi:hypothetical protein
LLDCYHLTVMGVADGAVVGKSGIWLLSLTIHTDAASCMLPLMSLSQVVSETTAEPLLAAAWD